ncbi:MAG: FAD-dependent oxidoreductase, partial [Candidatus Omnitrophota bacterium]
MKKIIIIGGGFAGLTCIRKLNNFKKKLDLEITLIDKKSTFDFLPMLPDFIGRNINPEFLINEIDNLG